MRTKTKDMMGKVRDLLIENEYTRAKTLAKQCHLSVGSVCRIIRIMRQTGTGVHVTKQGYALSQFARKTDDVYFLRRLMGRRASDFTAVKAAQPYIRRRWKTMEDRRDLARIVGPLTSDPSSLSSSMKVLTQRSERLGI